MASSVLKMPVDLDLVRVTAVAVGALTGGVFVWRLYRRRQLPKDQLSKRVVAITGCDSGVGFSAAMHCHQQGFHVVAMVLSLGSNGAELLRKNSNGMDVIGVDVTKPEEVLAACDHVNKLLDAKTGLVFHALINNAGVMVFGETEWQTEKIISLQLDVNLHGAIRVAKHFAPFLRRHKGRIVNVTSHCSSLPLPGLAVYAASKAGLQAWSDALRVEWAKYGITVISLVPGAFFQQTNIMSRQAQYAQEMKEGMSREALDFYGDYYSLYQMYLSGLSGDKPATVIESSNLYSFLDSALMDVQPRAHYHDTPWRYAVYHKLAHLAPTSLRDRLVTWFTAMPEFRQKV